MAVLRDYQEQGKLEVRNHFKDKIKRVLVAMATGAGKTTFSASIIKDALAAGSNIIFLAHRTELIENAASRLKNQMGIECGIINNSKRVDASKRVQIGSPETLYNRVSNESKSKIPANLIIIDECHHHSKESRYQLALEAYPNAYVIGLTATPFRLDGNALDYYQRIVHPITMRALIKKGFLVPCKFYLPKGALIPLEDIKKRGGEYDINEVSERFAKKTIIDGAIENYKEVSGIDSAGEIGKQCIIFCSNVKNSKATAAQFVLEGVKAAHVDGTTPKKEREQIFADFRAKKYQVLCNCGIATEGVDIPNIEVCILLRKTASWSLFLQMVGRAMRPYTFEDERVKKHAIIIDCGGNVTEHGIPEDYDLNGFSLKGKIKKPHEPKLCESCDTGIHIFAYEDEDFRYYECNYCSQTSKKAKRVPVVFGKSEVFQVVDREHIILSSLFGKAPGDFIKKFKKGNFSLAHVRIWAKINSYGEKGAYDFIKEEQLAPENFDYNSDGWEKRLDFVLSMEEENAELSDLWETIKSGRVPETKKIKKKRRSDIIETFNLPEEDKVLLRGLFRMGRKTVIKNIATGKFPLAHLRLWSHMKGYKSMYPLLFLKNELVYGFEEQNLSKKELENVIQTTEEEAGITDIWSVVRLAEFQKEDKGFFATPTGQKILKLKKS